MAYIEKRGGKRGVTYRVRVTVKGAVPQTRSFRRRTDAAEWATRTEAALRDGQALPGRLERDRTVADLTAHYRTTTLTVYSARERGWRTTKLDWWDRQLGARRVLDLKAPDFSECLRRLAAGDSPSGEPAGPATQVRYLAVIRHVLSVACRDWGWLPHNPAANVRTPREPRGRVRFLSEEERGRLLGACKQSGEARLFPLVVLALGTGARQSELLRLRWADVDFARCQAVVQESKNDERRALTLTGPALAVLREMRQVRQIHTDHIFATRAGRIGFPRKAWEAALRKAGVEDFHFHDLRHSFASYLAMSGATLPELAAALGHKTLAMVKRYAHLSEAHTSSVVQRMTEKFLS